MSSLRGYGRLLGVMGRTADLIPRADLFPAGYAPPIVADWLFEPGPPAPVQIPYRWLSPGLRYRPDEPITTAAVSVHGGNTTQRIKVGAVAEYGDKLFTAELATAVDQDAPNLADFMLAFYATPAGQVPRARVAILELQLLGRTVAEQLRILSVGQGQRIHITDTPATWPEGMAHQIVEGIHRQYANGAIIAWKTSPVVGTSAGAAGPWFRLGSSRTSSTHTMPY